MTVTRLQSLDGLRTISVALVVLSHLLGVSTLRIDADPDLDVLVELAGRLGVYLFFIISGFVICRGLNVEAAGTSRVSLLGFYLRRLFRIVPPLALYIAGVLALAQLGLVDVDLAIVRGLTFTCNVAYCGGWLGGHLWTLAYEEQFYLVMPALFILLGAWRPVVLTWLVPTAIVVGGGAALATGAGAAMYASLPILLIGLGVAAAMRETEIRGLVARSPSWLLPALVVAALLALRLTQSRLQIPAIMALGPLLTAVVMWVAFAPPRALCARPMVAVGKASYGIYLWQQVATTPYAGAGIVFYLAAIAACVVGALAAYRWIEAPLISYARTLQPLRRPLPAPAAVKD